MTRDGADLRGGSPTGSLPHVDRRGGSQPAATAAACLRGAVLCGGRSRRMGTDKALLVGADGRTLLERALRTLEAAGARAQIACGVEARYHDHLNARRSLVLDRAPLQAGPLGGLASVLDGAPDAGWTLTLPVDMAGVTPELLERLVARADETGADLCLASGPRGMEPLLGAFGPRCGALARHLLESGERRPIALADRRHGLQAVELRLTAPEAERALCNLNHPTDWERIALGAEAS